MRVVRVVAWMVGVAVLGGTAIGFLILLHRHDWLAAPVGLFFVALVFLPSIWAQTDGGRTWK